jgi:acyl-CoA reductase-like NAD-dependent aldehyde dehydrogenase
MATVPDKDAIKTITTHYIDGALVESHGQEVMDIIRPTDATVIARVTLGDQEDTRRAIAAAKRAFTTFGRTTKEERISTLRRLHDAVSARVDDLTAAMVEEYGGVPSWPPGQASRSCRGQRVGARRRSRWSRSAWPA